MRRSLVLSLPLLWAACGESGGVSLPKDAARPLRPAAALRAPSRSAADPASRSGKSTDEAPASDHDGPQEEAASDGGEHAEDPHVTRVSSRDVTRNLRPHFAGGKLAHRAYEAKFGPSGLTDRPTAVAFVRRRTPDRFSGFAVSAGRVFPFPALHESDLLPQDIAAIMFRNVDADVDRELVVLARYTSPDDPEDTFFDNVVLDWDEGRGAFVRLEAVEGEIEAFENTTAILRHLRSVEALPPHR